MIDNSAEGWALLVQPQDHERAQAAVNQYQVENRGWRWRRPLPETGLVFHWGSLSWVAGIIAVYYWSAVRFPGLKSAGILDSEKVSSGPMVAARYGRHFARKPASSHGQCHDRIPPPGAGHGALRSGSGIAGRVPGRGGWAMWPACCFIPSRMTSLGASGMVMGALGLITVQSFAPLARMHGPADDLFSRAVAAGVMILVLVGLQSRSRTWSRTSVDSSPGRSWVGVLGCAPPERWRSGPAQRGRPARPGRLAAGDMAAGAPRALRRHSLFTAKGASMGRIRQTGVV